MKNVLICICCLALSACKETPRKLSFYFWRTTFELNDAEIDALLYNNPEKLYVRYFDVDVVDGVTQPVSPITSRANIEGYELVPVVYIKNRVLEQLDTALAANVHRLVSQISRVQQIAPATIQFDCDWTEKTKEQYFQFIRQYKAISKQTISATIRLHQVKYPERTGVPPVDHGVLMYYNMGNIDAGPQNSIYEKSIAAKYNSSISSYPITLDVALPIFSWGLQIRDGKVRQLLNKIYFTHFENDSNFSIIKKNWYRVHRACFKAGYYFAENDVIKIENIAQQTLLDMANELDDKAGSKIRDFIFYDLDSANLAQYEKDIFKKVLDHAR